MNQELDSMQLALRRHWRKHSALVALLTLAWAAVSFVPPLLVVAVPPWLESRRVMWFIAEVAPVLFLVIAWAYAHFADKLDAEYGEDSR